MPNKFLTPEEAFRPIWVKVLIHMSEEIAKGRDPKEVAREASDGVNAALNRFGRGLNMDSMMLQDSKQ